MTASTIPDIAPRLVDGEPVCDRGCYFSEHINDGPDGCPMSAFDEPCIPGLRRQRCALQAERDAARRELCEQAAENKRRMAGVIAWRGRDEADVRGWSYLYEVKP